LAEHGTQKEGLQDEGVMQAQHLPETRVTVAVPTWNRSALLKICLESILAQDYEDFCVVVLDNASSDDTRDMVAAHADPRLHFVGCEENIGQLLNWNRAITLNSSPYLNIFHDDDLMLPGFVSTTVRQLEENPDAAISCTLARNIDIEGQPLGVEGLEEWPGGIIDGAKFLHTVACGQPNAVPPSSIMFRASALEVVGKFDSPHNRYHIDRNILYRIASKFDIGYINRELIQLRCHKEQLREQYVGDSQERIMIPAIAERIDAIGMLLLSKRAEDPAYRRWLEERLLFWNASYSEFVNALIPNSYWSWSERLSMVAREITEVVPAGGTLVLIDDDQIGSGAFEGYQVVPYVERNGEYWGAPSDDETAVRELERLREAGAGFVVVGWPAFSWLEHYSGLREHLQSSYRVILSNSRLLVYDLHDMQAA
jgi:glycosyltransferase involved in cell wall biosynthesis